MSSSGGPVDPACHHTVNVKPRFVEHSHVVCYSTPKTMRQQKNISFLCHVPKEIISVVLIYLNDYKNKNISKLLEK